MSNNQNKGEMKCEKCKGAGWYQYSGFNGDTPHSTICDECCTHSKGFWELKEHYGDRNGKMCCINGCGFTREKLDTDIEAPQPEKQDVPSPNPLEEEWEKEFDNEFPPSRGLDIDIYRKDHITKQEYITTRRKVIKAFILNLLTRKHLSYNQGVADEYKRCLSVLNIDHTNCPLKQTCIGYQSSLSDLENNPPLSNQVGNNK